MKTPKSPFDYLFYKLHAFYYHMRGGGSTHVAVFGTMGILILLNVFTVYLLLYGELSDTFMDISIIAVSLFMLLLTLPKRMKKVTARYENESETSRVVGNAFVTLYVIGTIVGFILAIR